MLSLLGYTVIEAMDGKEAVHAFQQNRDDIIFVLSDFAMPEMNGMELLNILRRMAPEIPVILASGYSEEQVINENPSEHPRAFLEKPYGMRELRKAITLALLDNPA